MADRIEPMLCPYGHGPMNCHAEKPVEPQSEEEARAAETGAGSVEQIHTCPKCGAIESRRVMA
ncbi:MAG TPA: hypothetical protein VKF80_08700 [Candidatus Eisenbacteria bacterium]|nr:hypothetical protein [Candidatus Eisenbacteria bacterium]